MKGLSENNRNKLKEISTATIATALYKRGYRNQYIQNVYPLNQLKDSMVGEAFTLRYIPAREDLNPVSVFRDPEHPQRVAVEQCPSGAVLVIDSRNNPKAASAGSILVTRLMKRGVAGIVTDGGFRDASEISKLNFPAFHQRPSAPTNLTLHQALDINIPVGCGEVAVFPGDIIVGDADGVMVIPQGIIDEVVNECEQMTSFEAFVMERVSEGDSIIGLYPPTSSETLAKFEEWKKSNPNK